MNVEGKRMMRMTISREKKEKIDFSIKTLIKRPSSAPTTLSLFLPFYTNMAVVVVVNDVLAFVQDMLYR
jgi:hypothetical protein